MSTGEVARQTCRWFAKSKDGSIEREYLMLMAVVRSLLVTQSTDIKLASMCVGDSEGRSPVTEIISQQQCKHEQRAVCGR